MRQSKNNMFTVRKLYSVLKYGVSALFVFFVIGLLNGSKRNSTADSDVHQELLLAKEYFLEDIKLYEAMIAEDEARVVSGWGEMGGAVNLRGEDLAKGEASFKKNAINVYLSDRISLNRTLADYRDPKCRKVLYDAQLPSTSVIIIFHNEPYSVLLRTIWSVLNSCRRTKPWFQQSRFYDFKWTNISKDTEFIGSPGSDPDSEFVYLKEIILVDDNSTLPELRGKLGYYIRTRFPQDLVKLIRLPSRLGLTRARLEGAKVAVADTLIFLDAHCEPSADWMRPMLQRIKEKRDTALVPLIDVISNQNFYYSTNGIQFQVGGFDFDGQFTWIDVSDAEKKRRGSAIAPTWSPTMAGGLFAIDRKYFWEIGSYDEQMDGWGGENLEMSFRIWQCGGTLETIPCSRVGHIFRAFHPYKFPGEKDTHGINTVRLAKVWMDDYADIFFLHRPDLLDYDVGDLTHRKVLREKLKCKPFQWYLDNIYKDKFIPTRNVSGYGRIMHPSKKYCIDTMQREEEQSLLGVYPCHEKISMTQFFSITKKGELRTETLCAQIQYRRSKKTVYHVMMDKCHGMKRDQEWKLIPNKKNRFSIMHLKTGSCLDINGYQGGDLETKKCDNSSSQRWIVEFSKLNNFSDAKNPIAVAFEQAGYLSEETSPKALELADNKKPTLKETKPDEIPEVKYNPEPQYNVIHFEEKDEIKGFKSRKLQAMYDDEDTSSQAKHSTSKTTVSTASSVAPHRKRSRSSSRRNGRNRSKTDALNGKKRAEHTRRKHHHNTKDEEMCDDKAADQKHQRRSKGKKKKDKEEGKTRAGGKRTKVVDQEGVEGEDKLGSVWKASKMSAKPDESDEEHTKKGGKSNKKHQTTAQFDSDGERKPVKANEGEDKELKGKPRSNEEQDERHDRIKKKAVASKKKQTTGTVSAFDVGKDSDMEAISMNDMVSIESAEGRGPVGVDNNAALVQRTDETSSKPVRMKTRNDEYERYKEVQEEESYSAENDDASTGRENDKRKTDTTTISSSSASVTTKETHSARVIPKRDRIVYKKKDESSYEDK